MKLRRVKMVEIEAEILHTWICGNYSLLDRHDLIEIARYFESKYEELK
jgi:hypothetical protein